ncbi:MAG: hypothetical protein M4579_004999 [Chaenotheca gracillima]|nr:MAG: hypothetical protein M4579_004999 [Chaenotheca gracillima]
MPGLVLMEGGEMGATYLQPPPKSLDALAVRWWRTLIQTCHEEYRKKNWLYGVNFSSTLAAAYEIQSWELHHKTSELSKALFFRKLALALALKRRANDETKAALKTKCAFSLLVKATFANDESALPEVRRLVREATSVDSSTDETRMLLARMLLWFVCNGHDTDPVGDLNTVIEYIEEAMETTPLEFSDQYGNASYLRRAYEARFVIGGEEEDMQKAASVVFNGRIQNSEGQQAHSIQMSHSRMEYVSESSSLGQVLVDLQKQGPSQDLNTEQEEERLHSLRKFHYQIVPGLVREALEAGLMACQIPSEVEESRRQGGSHFITGLNYLGNSGKSNALRFDLEQAVFHLEAALQEKPLDQEKEITTSTYLARARWELGKETHDVAMTQVAVEEMLSVLDAKPSPENEESEDFSSSPVLEMMASSHKIWESSKHKKSLQNAQRFAAHLLSEPNFEKSSPRLQSAVFCKAGEISAEFIAAKLDQTLLEEPIHYWTRCWQAKQAPLNARLHAMHLAARFLFESERFEEAFHYAKSAVELIRFACPADLDVSERESLIPLLNGISIDACALGLKLDRTEEALEILEQGRGILNFVPSAFADSLDDLGREHPKLFRDFDRCRQSMLNQVDSADVSDSKNLSSDTHGAITDFASDDDVERLAQILKEVRQLRGFSNFYRPVTAAEMQSVANRGPIVVLVGSSLIPYAVIVKQDSLQAVDLSGRKDPSEGPTNASFLHYCSYSIMSQILGRQLIRIKFDDDHQMNVQHRELDAAMRSQSLKDLLKFLWSEVVGPINEYLNFEGPKGRTFIDCVDSSWPNRVTWIRTGSFSRMPIHMATDSSNVPFIARGINSFVSSFQALSLSRSRQKVCTRGSEEGLLVTMPSKGPASANDKGGQPPDVEEIRSFSKTGPFLRRENVAAEVDAILGESGSINWSTLERPSAQQVKEKFASANFVHFVCHGVTDRAEPRKSHLKLWKVTPQGRGRVDPLYVSDISEWVTQQTALVFLSACSVADAESESFSEENLDIVNSFAVAGVPHVVGSMWPVSSQIATRISTGFWQFLSHFFPDGTMLEGDLVARALQIAVLLAAVEYPEDPLMWAGFIHIGGMSSQPLEGVDEDVEVVEDSDDGWVTTDDESDD